LGMGGVGGGRECVYGVTCLLTTLPVDNKSIIYAATHTRSVHLLSGDSPDTVAAVAAQAGIAAPNARGGMTPVEKLAAVQALRDQHGSVAMVSSSSSGRQLVCKSNGIGHNRTHTAGKSLRNLDAMQTAIHFLKA
jgi:hypothetical protein